MRWWVVLACVTPYAAAQAQSERPPDVEDFSMTDLLSVPVSTATKTVRAADETAVLVDVISHAQIRERGYRHLGDVLNDLPFNHEDRANWGIGEPVTQNVGFGFRFDTGQNILLLFNGQRLNAFLPGNRFGGEEYLLDTIERIEIIRGPGSALYGANAFTAVINLISRSSGRPAQARLAVGGIATSGGASLEGSLDTALGGTAYLTTAFRLATEHGQKINVDNQVFGATELRDRVFHTYDAEAKLSAGNLNAYFKASDQERRTFTGFNSISASDNRLRLSMYAYSAGADYSIPLGSSLSLLARAGWHQDNWTEVARIPLAGTGVPNRIIDGQGADTASYDAELQLTWTYFEENKAVLGLNALHDRILGARRPSELSIEPFEVVPFRIFDDNANNWLFDTNATRTSIGTFGQIDYALANTLFLSAGARFDHYAGTGLLDQTYNELNPRAGAVLKDDRVGSVKLSYGRATRVPNGFETLSSVTILGAPSNRPERVHNVQLAWQRSWFGMLNTELGAFYATISNRLQTDANVSDELRTRGFVGRFVNLGGRQFSSGANVSFTLRAGLVEVHGNATRYLVTDDGTGTALTYIPRTMANVIVSAPLWWLRFNVTANYRGDFNKPDSDPRPAVNDYVLLGALVRLLPPQIPLELRVGVRNAAGRPTYPSSSLDFPRNFPGRGVDLWGDIAFTSRF